MVWPLTSSWVLVKGVPANGTLAANLKFTVEKLYS